VLRDRDAAGELLDDDARATPRGSVQTPIGSEDR
jgi:hypothetical protein